MKFRRQLLQGALLVCALLTAGPAVAGPVRITLLHVNDTHSRLESWGPKDWHLDGRYGGLARVATEVAAVRSTGANVLFVHGGDLFHGDLFFQATAGVVELQLLTGLGLDAMALGNHELEIGPDGLAYALASAFPSGGSPVLSANASFFDGPGGNGSNVAPFVAPWMLKEVGGVKVGIFGLTTPYDFIAQQAELGGWVRLDPDLGRIAHDTALSLRAAGAQVVILLSHLGLDVDRAVVIPSGAQIDVIVGAHDHETTPQALVLQRPGGGSVVLAEAGAYYRWLGRLDLEVDGTSVTLAGSELISIDRSVARFPPVAQQIAGLEQWMIATFGYGDVFRTPVAWALLPFSNRFDPAREERDTDTGDLITDIYRQRGKTEIAVEAMGFQDGDLPAGPIVGEDIFRLMPYGFDTQTGLGVTLATFQLTGAQLLQGLEIGVAAGYDLMLQVSGMQYAYDSCRPPGGRVIPSTVKIGGRRLDPLRSYSVTANALLASLVPALLQAPVAIQDLGEPEYLVARDAIARRKLLLPWFPGRIRNLGTCPQ
jgi:5'-nucleotidase / UDP-sugar diphosphatase